MEYVIAVPSIPSLAVEGAGGRFPVHRIYCVGRNYAEHAREMGHDPDREPPFFFMKPADAIVTDGRDFAYPSGSADVHHELELVVALATGRLGDSRRPGPRLRVRLRGRARHDAAGPAGRGEEDGPAVGHRQGVRRVGAVQLDPPRGRDRSPDRRRRSCWR